MLLCTSQILQYLGSAYMMTGAQRYLDGMSSLGFGSEVRVASLLPLALRFSLLWFARPSWLFPRSFAVVCIGWPACGICLNVRILPSSPQPPYDLARSLCALFHCAALCCFVQYFLNIVNQKITTPNDDNYSALSCFCSLLRSSLSALALAAAFALCLVLRLVRAECTASIVSLLVLLDLYV